MQSILRITILVTAALLTSAGSAQTQKTVDRLYETMDPRTLEVVESYLRVDCEIGEVGRALSAVLKVIDAARPYLVAVQREGPPSAVLKDFERGLESTWAARLKFLETKDARELGPQSFEMMKAITKAQYQKDQSEAIQAKYRERAALALKPPRKS
jgi:hypothetical protein